MWKWILALCILAGCAKKQYISCDQELDECLKTHYPHFKVVKIDSTKKDIGAYIIWFRKNRNWDKKGGRQ